MKINEKFKLNKTQYELDFIDIDTNQDTPLFIDPYFLALRKDSWSIEASRTIRSFFQHLVQLLSNNQIEEARMIFSHLGEPNETCLGLSRDNPQGKGMGKTDANRIFESLLESKAVETGLLEDIEDCKIFVDKVDKDKISDMSTNLIREHLIEYTIKQCNLWNIPLTNSIASGFYWNRHENEWQARYSEMLVVDEKPILLVPKAIVSYKSDYTPSKYYRHFVLNFLQNEHLRLQTALVNKRVRKDGNETMFVLKRDVEVESPYSKEFLRKFTNKHPEVFENFKTSLENTDNTLSNERLGEIGLPRIAERLAERLQSIPTGNTDATEFHRLVLGILELLFYPNLTCPQIEREIHDGRKRIDITFDNAARDGFFFRLHSTYQTPSQFIIVECKNYTSDLANPELDQLQGRFSVNKGKFGLIVCRKIQNLELFLQRCTDTYNDGRGIIFPITDEDLLRLLAEIKNHNLNCVEEFLADRFRAITLR